MDLEAKRNKGIEIIELMIKIYCKKNDDINEEELINYCTNKIQKCPMMETKTFCSQCPVHCYQKDMREKIKKVMRYSGPRLIFHHPILCIKHYLLEAK